MNKRFLFASLIGFVVVAACKPTRTFLANEKVSYYRLKAADTLQADPSVEALIKPYRVKLEGQMNEVLGRTAQELTYRQPESLMGNWAADLILVQATQYYGKNIDFVAINQGGLRIRSMPKGDITRGKLFELMPFDNAIVVLTCDSAQVVQLVERIANRGGWPVSGIAFDIKDNKAQNIRIQGEQLRGGRDYVFVTSDYVADGGDEMGFLKNVRREALNRLMRDAFIEGVIAETKRGKVIDSQLDGRIVILK